MKFFELHREIDETGMSGIGIVAYGAVLENGHAIMRWNKHPHSIGVYCTIQDLEELHSHGRNTTKVVYTDHGHDSLFNLTMTLLHVASSAQAELVTASRGY